MLFKFSNFKLYSCCIGDNIFVGVVNGNLLSFAIQFLFMLNFGGVNLVDGTSFGFGVIVWALGSKNIDLYCWKLLEYFYKISQILWFVLSLGHIGIRKKRDQKGYW